MADKTDRRVAWRLGGQGWPESTAQRSEQPPEGGELDASRARPTPGRQAGGGAQMLTFF
jgi:hypothetical protein